MQSTQVRGFMKKKQEALHHPIQKGCYTQLCTLWNFFLQIWIFVWNCMKCPDEWRGEFNCQETFLLGINKISRSVQKSHVLTPVHPWEEWGGGEFPKNGFFARNQMKYPNIHSKIMFPTLNPIGMGLGSSSQKVARNWMRCADMHRKIICANLYLMVGVARVGLIFKRVYS